MNDTVPNAISFDQPGRPCETKVSQLMLEDLWVAMLGCPASDRQLTGVRDQLYLGQNPRLCAHPAPAKYFSWRRDPNKTEAQKCLQFAAWTLAASVSVPYQGVAASFYQPCSEDAG